MDSSIIRILQQIVTERGKSVLDDAALCKGLLNDYCKGQFKKEINVIFQALQSKIQADIANCNKSTLKIQIPLIAKKFQNEHPYDNQAVLWTVNTLATAMGTITAAIANPPKTTNINNKIILTPEQEKVLRLPENGAIQIKGVAGSGKTTVAIHRAKYLLDNFSSLFSNSKVIIFTYNKTLSAYIKNSLVGFENTNNKIKNVYVTNFHKWAYSFLMNRGYNLQEMIIKDKKEIEDILNKVKAKYSNENITKKNNTFFTDEFTWIKGKAILSQDEYLNVKRVGRTIANKVGQQDREIIWKIYEDFQNELKIINKIEFDDFALLLLKEFDKINFQAQYTHIVIDEAQDLTKAQLLVISKLVSINTNSVSIIADAAQKIYQSGFSWSEIGFNVRGGRTVELKKNHRNTVQIAEAANSLLEKETDKSEFTQLETTRNGTNKPIIAYFNNWDSQIDFIKSRLNLIDFTENDVVILHRKRTAIDKIADALQNDFPIDKIVGEKDGGLVFKNSTIKICTMPSVKGLEFDIVFVIDANEDVLPYPADYDDTEDWEDHVSKERRLLYVCMTRAKEELFICSSGKPSRFLDEIDSNLVEIIK